MQVHEREGEDPGVVCGAMRGKEEDPTAFQYRRTSISGKTFSGKKCLSGTIFHAI
jgi:hypothetical protein